MTRRWTWFLVAMALAFLGGGFLLRRTTPEQAVLYGKARLLDDIVGQVAAYYVDSLDQIQLYDLALDGMLRGLGDPYSAFYREAELQDLATSTTGNYGGVGIRIEASEGGITVITPLTESPADSAGILPGDRIIQVNETSTRGWTVDEAGNAVRGTVGTSVSLRVQRAGVSQPLDFHLTRAAIHVNAVRYGAMASEDVGYIWLETVSESSASELSEEIERLERDGARGLILDLRFNPGGLLDQTIAITDLFLPEDRVVVETRGRAAAQTYRAPGPARWPDLPLVLLVNGFTASAAEIIAGAVQDHDRGVVFGDRTFGKGLVQTVFPFSVDQALKLTTGRWFTPSGRSIQRAPVSPAARDVADSTEIEEPARGDSIVGGIVPDRFFAPDSVDVAGRDLYAALGPDIQVFRDVLNAYARELSEGDRVVNVDFVPTVADRDMVWRRLAAAGVRPAPETRRAAAAFVDRQLAYRTIRYAAGRSAEMQRRMQDDPLVRAAVTAVREDVAGVVQTDTGPVGGR